MCNLRLLIYRLLLATLFLVVAGTAARADAPATPAVTVTGTVSSKSITQDECLRFTVTVENQSSDTLTNLRLSRPPDGYQWLQIHAQGPQGSPAYYEKAVDFERRQEVLFPSVPPGAIYTAWGYLKPTVSHKTATLTAEADWTLTSQKPDAAASSATVQFGENAVQSEGDILWGYTTVLALPVVLALLPFIISGMLKSRDERSETQRLLLAQSLDYAAKYYLPLSAAAQKLVDALRPLPQPGQQQSPNELFSFYSVVYLEKRMTEQRKAVGGFYFKDLRAEALASLCWKEYSEAIFGRDPTEPLNRATQACVNKLRDRENFDAFAKKLEMNTPAVFANPDAQQAWLLFKARLQSVSVDALIVNLNTLQALIDYEVNRPLVNWYPTALPPFIVDRDVKKKLEELAKKLQFTPEQRAYVDEVQVLPKE